MLTLSKKHSLSHGRTAAKQTPQVSNKIAAKLASILQTYMFPRQQKATLNCLSDMISRALNEK